MPALKNVFTLDVARRHHDYAFDRLGTVIVKSLHDSFAHGNLPISQVDAAFFRTHVSHINPGIARDRRAWLGICFATARQLHFWGLVHEVDEKASTIANPLADTILDVRMQRLIMCSILKGNTSKGVRLSNPGLRHQCNV
jgi:hypothetical protein